MEWHSASDVRNPLVKITLLLVVALWVFGRLMLSHTAAADSAPGASQENASASQEEKVVADNCEICHSDVLIRQQHLNEKAWFAELQKMRSWGSPIEVEQLKPLAAYLANVYQVDAPPYVARTIPAAQELASYQRGNRGPAGDAARGKSLYADACASCHGPVARGALGPELVSVPVLWRWNDFNDVVRHGRGRMPGFEKTITTRQTADILAWLRSLRVSAQE